MIADQLAHVTACGYLYRRLLKVSVLIVLRRPSVQDSLASRSGDLCLSIYIYIHIDLHLGVLVHSIALTIYITSCLLPTTYDLLSTTYYLLITTYSLPPTTDYRLPTTNYLGTALPTSLL